MSVPALADGRGRGARDRLRAVVLGVVGSVALAALLAPSFGVAGVAGAAVVALVFAVLGGPYGYAVGQVVVAAVLPVPLDDPAFVPVQGALVLVCFGRLLATARVVETVGVALGSLVVVGALLVVSLGSVASLWQTSLLLVFVGAVATALFRWYEPQSATVESA
ncbi:hypothetical protein [Salinigranum halophilum]|uniref:hypothetical protein n=1 Tax=Salinigranum halophilum TaxID=2565931 RepID=UPI0010A76A7C|nr:hypothetical protein [Salinigranum halophilum]